MVLEDIIKKMQSKSDLDKNDLQILIENFREKQIKEDSIKQLVIAWNEKGYKPEELKGLADIIFELCPQVSLSPNPYPLSPIDMCGTGGDRANTFNISTLAAIVASACGAKVIKHSGRSTTSISGSVDVLNEFGFNMELMELNEGLREYAFQKTGLMFVSSRTLRELFGEVKQICKKINLPGFINLLGPLVNPYHTDCQLLGVSSLKWGKLMAEILRLQGKKEAIVVCSSVDETGILLDEFSLSGNNIVWHLNNGNISERQIKARDLGLPKVDFRDITVKDKIENKEIFEKILKGKLSESPYRAKADTVSLNSGAALYLQKKVKSISDGYYVALKAIHDGLVWEHFQKFLNCNKMKS